MEEQIQRIEVAAKKTWPVVMAWIGGITAVIGLVASIAGGVTWLTNRHRHSAEYQARMALAQTQANQQQYQAALKTYSEILKDDPLNRPALEAQLDTAMLWAENFSVYVEEGKDESDLSASELDEILPVLTAGITRVKGTRWADLEAHLGWAHFLDAELAQRENASVAVDDWHSALLKDPKNVYAHAMLGNWLLQSDGNLAEAVDHFKTAVATGQARPFVRSLQVGGLLHLEVSGARAELIRVANEMRRGGELLDPEERHRITGWCFDPIVTDHRELVEALSAVSNDDAWQTYLWLSRSEKGRYQDLKQQFIHANLLELAGRNDAALSAYRQIQAGLRNQSGSLRDQVDAAVARLTRG